MRHALLGLVALLSACGDDAAPVPTPSPAEPVEPVAPAAPAAPTVAPAPPAPAAERHPAPVIAPEVATQARAAIRDGRRLVRTGDFTGALARFEEALTASPSPRLACETGYVAHLAGQDERARTLIDRALHLLMDQESTEAGRVPLAMCLYNAGLVYESAGERTAARDAFARSLELRENATVRERLAALSDAAAPPPEPAAPTTADGTSVEAIRPMLAQVFCDASELEECVLTEGESHYGYDDEGPVPVAVGVSDTGPVGTASGLTAWTADAAAGWDESTMLVVNAGGHFLFGEIGHAYNPGAFGVSGDVEIESLQYLDVVPGGATEVVARVRVWYTDNDLAGCEGSSADDLRIVVCTVEAERPRCIAVPVESSFGSGATGMDGCEEYYTDGATPPPSTASGFAMGAAIDGDALVLTSLGRTFEEPATPPVGEGRHTFTELFARADLAWPAAN